MVQKHVDVSLVSDIDMKTSQQWRTANDQLFINWLFEVFNHFLIILTANSFLAYYYVYK